MNVLSFKILRLNSSFNISCKSYASVGYCSDIEFDDRYFDLDVSSSVPEHCPCGGDSGTKTYNLTARKSGFTKAILTQYFRGNVKKRTGQRRNSVAELSEDDRQTVHEEWQI